MGQYKVTYDILTESRTDSFLGSSRTDLQNLTTVVTASSQSQARSMVEAMNGGSRNCVVKFTIPL